MQHQICHFEMENKTRRITKHIATIEISFADYQIWQEALSWVRLFSDKPSMSTDINMLHHPITAKVQTVQIGTHSDQSIAFYFV